MWQFNCKGGSSPSICFGTQHTMAEMRSLVNNSDDIFDDRTWIKTADIESFWYWGIEFLPDKKSQLAA
jgi:hypothetical protein